MFKRFSNRECANPFEFLAALQQKGNIKDYIEQFEKLASHVADLPEEQYLGYFLNGLREDIRRRVRVFEPRDVMRAIDLARMLEDEVRGDDKIRRGGPREVSNCGWARIGQLVDHMRGASVRPIGTGSGLRNDGLGVGPGPRTRVAVLASPPFDSNRGNSRMPSSVGSRATTGENNWGNLGNNSRGSRNLTYQEYMEKREKGLCFRYDQPYTPQHKCAVKSLRVVILADDEEMEAEDDRTEESESEDQQPLDLEQKHQVMELPMYSIGGISRPRTMKLFGKINSVPVIVMIDSGASHNFVSSTLVEQLGLPVRETPQFGV